MLQDSILNIKRVANEGNFQLATPELSVLIFLKFTSDNAEQLGVTIDRFHSYNALVSLFTNRAITVQDFLDGCSEIVSQTGMDKYGIIPHLSLFLAPLADKKEMHQILNLVAEMDLTDNPQSCKVAHLMEFIISAFRVTAHGDYNTSSDFIATLMANMVVSEGCTSIYDGVCGYGLSLMKAHMIAPQALIEGQDKKVTCVMVSAIMQWVAFRSNFEIAFGDTLREPLPTKTGTKYDAVLMAPPFLLRMDEDVIANASEDMVKYRDLLSKKGDWFFVQHTMAVLSENGAGILHLPMGAFFQGGKVQAIRKIFVEKGHIQAVIALPAGAVPGSAVSSGLVIVRNKPCNEVLFVDGTASRLALKIKKGLTVLSPKEIDTITAIVLERKEIDGISKLVSAEQISKKNFLLTPSVYTDISDSADLEIESVDTIYNTISSLEQEFLYNGKKLENAVQNFMVLLGNK